MSDSTVAEINVEELDIDDIIYLRHGMHWYSGKDDFPIGFMEQGTKLQILAKRFDGDNCHIKAKLLVPWFNLDDKQVMNLNESSLVFFGKVS